MMINKKCFFIFLISCSFVSLGANDLPVFYRAPLFQAFHDQQPDWTTQLSVRFGGGDTRKGRNVGEHKTDILNIYGPTNISTMGIGLENLDKKPETKKYWDNDLDSTSNTYGINTKGLFKEDVIKKLALCDAKIQLSGRIKVYDLGITLKQSIFSGFYGLAYMPIRRVTIDSVCFKNLGSKEIKSDTDVVVDEFLKEVFPKILEENCFGCTGETTLNCNDSCGCPIENSSCKVCVEKFFKKTNVPEILLAVGWQGTGSESFGIVDKVRGYVQAGVLIPTSGRVNQDRLFAIPLGYGDFWGFNCQMGAEVALWKIVLGAHAGVSAFLPSDRSIRMKTDRRQSGWLMLGKGRAKVDRGSVWDLTGYVKADKLYSGFSCLIGYSFTRKEHTDLNLRHKDDCFLSTLVDFNKNNKVVCNTCTEDRPIFISREEIVNDDQRFKGWNQQTLHLLAEFDTRTVTDRWFAPIVRVEYSHALYGKRIFSTNVIAGTLGLQMTWNI